MAIVTTTLKNSSHEAVIKVTGAAADSTTLDISTLVNANQTLAGGNVVGVVLSDPARVITSAPHFLRNGDKVTFASVGGTVELNGNSYYVSDIDAITIELYSDATLATSVDATAFTAYTTGGTVVINPKVNIAGVKYAGTTSSVVTVTRNSINVMAFSTEGVDGMDFAAGWVDTQENEFDIGVAFSGGAATVYLTLRKQTGFLNNIETATYSVYDNEAAAGA